VNASPWHTKRTIDATATARTRVRIASDWTPPTVRPFVAVARGEFTCTHCGETFGAKASEDGKAPFCWRCGHRDGVPTISYLQPHEITEEYA